MNLRSSLVGFIAIFVLILAGCDSPEQEQAPPVQENATAQTEVTDSDATEAATTEKLKTLTTVEETEGLAEEVTVEEIELGEPAPAAQTSGESKNWQYTEGKHYRRLTASQGTSSPPDKIEVAEVFWYGCPHCFNFDPVLAEWQQSLAPDVSFVKIPVIWNPTNQVHARIMYTAEALGILDEVHQAIFQGIHQKNKNYTSDAEIIELFAQFDIAEPEFREAYNSFGVTSAVKRAENLTRRYGIRSVPVLVINGKYVTDSPEIKSFGDMLNVTNELVERERVEP